MANSTSDTDTIEGVQRAQQHVEFWSFYAAVAWEEVISPSGCYPVLFMCDGTVIVMVGDAMAPSQATERFEWLFCTVLI